MEFKMKGFSPFTKETEEKKTWKERWDEKYSTSYDSDDDLVPNVKPPDWDKIRKTRSKGDPANAHHVEAGPIAKGSSMSPAEQQKIQRTIKNRGHFGDIDPSLVKGYGSRDSHSYRKRVAEINAHHQYMSHSDPYDKGRGRRKLQSKLNQLQNWDTRYTDFTG